MIMTPVGWANLSVELESTFMSGSSVILQRMGYAYGKYLAKVAKQSAAKQKKQVTPKSILNIMMEAAKSHGWGMMTLGGGDFETGAATLIVKDCFFCMHEKKGTASKCYFLVGILGGVADEVAGMSHRVSEGRCSAKDDGLCEFRAERVAPTGGA